MWTTEKLRSKFLTFFKDKNHTVVPSSSVIPNNDPSLLFTNSGMVQFKDILLGGDSELKRACSVQRCIRAGGKHNDLDDVGKDNYHHTFFEMLGNWSFGAYFKEEAIDYAWDFLVNELGLDSSRLYVTYYDELDKDSLKYWSKYLPKERILSASYKDNFWEMGETGPCGPCTEIHYDRIGGRDASSLVNMDDPDVIEIWNIVFIEFNRTGGCLKPLDRKCIDTGIGLERVLSILNGVRSNYLIDTFGKIISFIEENCEFKYEDKNSSTDVAFRVLSDHCRTISVCLHDKVEFKNDGQGYVLRRILRRSVRYAHDVLRIKEGVLSKIVKVSAESLGIPPVSLDIVDYEEQLFLKTLKKGIERFRKMTQEKKLLSGKDVFTLYDTYGFPTDLTCILAEEKNITVDMTGYEDAKTKAKEVSKKVNDKITEIISDLPKTDDSYKYTTNKMDTELLFYVLGKNISDEVSEIPENIEVGLVFKETCFYGECGGQVGDKGTISFLENNKILGTFRVEDTKILNGYVLHYGRLEGLASRKATLEFDEELRNDTKCNHTATHLFNYFLRKYIKTEQKGSLVTPNKLRFDFEGKKVDLYILKEIEDTINSVIEKGANVTPVIYNIKDCTDDIIYMKNEKYPEKVRVITIELEGNEVKELCGGTHVDNTKDIYKFRIVSESGISANVRRIVGITGREVKKIEKLMENSCNVINNIPLFDKLRLEEKKKEMNRIVSETSREVMKLNKNNVSEIILNKKLTALGLGNNSVQEILVYEYETNDILSIKDTIKCVHSLIGEIKKINYFIYFEKSTEFVLFCKNNQLDKTIIKLRGEFPDEHFRITKDFIHGVVREKNSKDKTKERIINLLK